VSYWTGREGVASSQMTVTIGRQARQKVRPSDCRAERTGTTPFKVIILKLKEGFRHVERPVKFRVLKNFALKKTHKTWKPYILNTKLGAMHKS
jgi:hypothetical protein